MLKYAITIPRPCPASWAAMSPAAAGRHCAACQKTVVDFSRLPLAEVLAYLAEARAAGVCGRFRAGQVAARPQPRLLVWRAAPRLALSLAAVLALTHCTSPEAAAPPEAAGVAVQQGITVRGRILD